MKIREDVTFKDQRIRELEAHTRHIMRDMEYYKIEYHRMEALIEVLERRGSDTNPQMPSNTQKSANVIQDIERERWIPPTGFLP